MIRPFLRRAGLFVLFALVFCPVSLFAQESTPDANAIRVVGSGIVAPVFRALADASGVEANLDVEVTGTSNGLQALCAGETDVANATRPISTEEDAACGANSVDYVELLIGHDILAFIANPENDFLQCLTNENVNSIFAPSAEGQVTNWNQVNSEFPDLALTLYAPDENTVWYSLLDDIVEGDGIRGDANVQASDGEIVSSVSEDSGALGAASLASAAAAGDSVKILQFDDGSGTGCADPSVENVESDVYSANDPLFVYVNSASLSKPGLRDMLDFAVGDEAAAIISPLGVTPPTSDAYATDREALSGAQSGRQFSQSVSAFQIPPGLSGEINIGGAANGYMVVKNASDAFKSQYQGVTINLNVAGETAGFRRLCNGEIDIALASNDLTEEQHQNCDANNITLLDLNLGTQATVLVANAASDYLQCLTTDQLVTIWGAASEDRVTTWNQVSSDFPEETMTLFAPQPGNAFTDIMLIKSAGTDLINRVDTQLNNDPLYRAAATANVEGALTYMSWSDYQRVVSNNQANIQLVGVDAGNGCIAPSAENVTDGSYPLSRPGKLLVNQASLAKVEVQSFLWYLMSDDNFHFLEDQGFVGLSLADLAAARTTLQDAFTAAVTAQAEATAEPGVESTAEPGGEATAEATAGS